MEAEPSYPAEIVGTDAKLLIPHPVAAADVAGGAYLTREGKTDVIRIEADDVPQHRSPLLCSN
jgi:hypothetical protein